MKLGMVFEGGANRTVFSCGVMDKFLEENIMPDYYIGVSAGMAYGLSYLSGQKGRNLELMEKYMADKRYMGMRHLLNRKEHAYYNTKFVFEEVPNEILPLDYDALARFPGEIEAAVTNIHTGKAEYMEVPRGKEMKDLLIATCSLPILFQPVKIGRHYYLDGGLADSVPYEHAMEMGCEKLVVVLTRERGYVDTGKGGRRYEPSLSAISEDRGGYETSRGALQCFHGKTDAVRERGKSICDRTGVDLWSWQDGDGYHKIAQAL